MRQPDAPAEQGPPRTRSARRGYRSDRRQEQAAETRGVVLTAATSLFAGRGWSGTGMRDVARAAGVAVETVYANFRSKPDLLLASIDMAVVGDTDAETLSERADFAALGVGTVTERVATAARMLTGINTRTAGLISALHEAATGDPRLAAKLRELETSRRDNTCRAAELIAGRPVDADVVDALWAVLGSDAFHLITRIGGRSEKSYEQWVARTMHRLIAEPPKEES